MDIVIASHDMTKRAVLRDYKLDLETGLGTDNDFDLSVPVPIYAGDVVWCPGTGFGGVVDDDMPSMSDGVESISYHGRTWEGVLDANVTKPPAGESHMVVSGDPEKCLSDLLSACGVGEPFRVSAGAVGSVEYTVPRFATLYEAMVGALSSAGLALRVRCLDGTVELSAREPSVIDESSGVGYRATRGHRPVNHLVVLGKGEMQDREVLDLYADEDGAVSGSQTLFGLDHRADVYELSNEEGTALEEAGRKRLAELYEQRDETEIVIPRGVEVSVGDTLSATSPRYAVRASAVVTGVVVVATNGTVSVTPRTKASSVTGEYE